MSGPEGLQPVDVHRIFGIVPVVDAPLRSDTVAPLATKQKYALFAKTTFDPATVLIGALGGAIAVPGNAQPAFGSGWAAYGERTGAIAADLTSNDLFSRAMLPSMLHQDPRYFRKGHGSAVSRVFYAISRTLVTRTDRGNDAFNSSYLAGYAVSVALSNVYYPNRNRNAADSVSRYGQGLGINMAINILREFRNEH
jgi:hypothetical protein